MVAFEVNRGGRRERDNEDKHYSLILPVLFYEYLALSLARSLIPSMMVDTFGLYTYLVVGIMEAVRGSLAFIACPLFGKLSDRIGRKFCLMASVAGMGRNTQGSYIDLSYIIYICTPLSICIGE